MAQIDDLLSEVGSAELRRALGAEISELRRRKSFGLVFERHLPEYAVVSGQKIYPGTSVVHREDPETRFIVLGVTGTKATIEANGTDQPRHVLLKELLVVKGLGEPIYPGLTPVERIERSAGSPSHAVINGENFHALQLLDHLYRGQVDVIYIDPPYNSGATDWTYNNRFIDDQDRYRHSKWLSFMDKRLRLAKRLLRPDGVLIVTVDENEVGHLHLLLEQVMPEYLRYMVTIVSNPKGTFKQNFGRVEEYAFFCCPREEEVILGRPRGEVEEAAAIAEAEGDAESAASSNGKSANGYEDLYLRRRGSESSFRHQRPNQFYAILVDEEEKKVVGIGSKLSSTDDYKLEERKGKVLAVYPVDAEGNERTWRYSRETMEDYIEQGVIVVGRKNKFGYALNHRKAKTPMVRLKTVWWDPAHDAGTHGSTLLTSILGKPHQFPFPKSVYAVRDCLAAVVRDRPNGLIVDFFAGSGTTLHATLLLNAEDDGRRRCVLVTNNEIDAKSTAKLRKQGRYPGSKTYEAEGVFEKVTRPRCKAVVTGKRPDGTKIPGKHRNGRPLSQGFKENIEFFHLDYLEPNEVELGRRLKELLPALWLQAGGVGPKHSKKPFSVAEGSPYALLVDEAHIGPFAEAVHERPDITHLFLATNSEEAYAEMCQTLGSGRVTEMLYSDYLGFFRRYRFGRR